MILHPEKLQGIAEPIGDCVLFIDKRAKKELGFDTLVVFGFRNEAQQGALWAQGRYPLDYVNGLRHNSGLSQISEKENEQIVTKDLGGQSPHNFHAAVDVVGFLNGEPQWNNDAYFKIVGEETEKFNLRWGGKWKGRDYGHIEKPGWKKTV